MNQIEVKVYRFSDTEREVHMVGEYVGVCWPLKLVERSEDGWPVSYHERGKRPYIDFVWIRQAEKTGEYWIDEDSPVQGGFSVEAAEQIAKELLLAVEYMKGLKKQ